MPSDYTAKRLMSKYWTDDLPEFYYIENEAPEDNEFNLSWSLVSTLFAVLLSVGTLFMGLTELAVACMILAIGVMSLKIFMPEHNKQLAPADQQEIKLVLEPQHLVYHFRYKQTEAYQTIKIRYDWIAELEEYEDGVRLIGHKKQDTWQVNFAGEHRPVMLPKKMVYRTHLKHFLDEFIRQKKQPKTSLIP